MDRSKLFKKLGIVLGALGIVTIGVIGTSLVKASEDI